MAAAVVRPWRPLRFRQAAAGRYPAEYSNEGGNEPGRQPLLEETTFHSDNLLSGMSRRHS